MPTANPFAKFPTAASPSPAPAGPVSGSDSNLLTDYHDRVEQAADALWKDVTTPLSGRERMSTAVIPGGERGVQTASDALNYVASPVSALFDSGPGRAVEALSGGRIPRQTAGNVAMMALPVAGEAFSEAKLAEAAKAAGVSIDTLRANLEARAAASAAGQKVDSAKVKAARRLITEGKLKSPDARAAAAEHHAVGAHDPSLLDVMEPTAQRVVRAAGARMGDADTKLTAYQKQSRANVSPRGVQRSEELSPHADDIESRKAAKKKERDALAQTQYREPYAQPIQSDDRMFEILNSPAAFNAMADAAATARERALTDPSAAQQFHEITSLRDYFTKKAAYEQAAETWQDNGGGTYAQEPSGTVKDMLNNPQTSEAAKAKLREQLGWKPTPKPEPPAKPTVSGGTLDRIRISLRDKADTLSQAGRRGRAGGVGDRGRALDEYLDEVPHLKEARASYADYSKQIEQLDFDQSLSTMRPEAFRASLKDLTPEQRQERIHAVSEQLAGKFGTSGRAAQGAEDVLTTSDNGRQNLRELLGDDVANDYLRAVDLIGQSVDKANFVASRVGSKTASSQEDLGATASKGILRMLMGDHSRAVHLFTAFVERTAAGNLGGPMSSEEATQIAEWATQQKNVTETLQDIADAAGGDKKAVTKLPPDIRALIPVAASAEARGGEPQPSAPPVAGANPFARFAKPAADPAKAGPPKDPAAPAPAAPPADSTVPIPNNNPANLRPANWSGQTGVADNFAVFDTPAAGWAAADHNLLAKVTRHGLKTLNQIIGEPGVGWAPAGDGDNNPAAYVAKVAPALGITGDEDISDRVRNDPEFRHKLLEAMVSLIEIGKPVPYGGGLPGATRADQPGGQGQPGGAAPAGGDSGFTGSVADYVPAIGDQ